MPSRQKFARAPTINSIAEFFSNKKGLCHNGDFFYLLAFPDKTDYIKIKKTTKET